MKLKEIIQGIGLVIALFLLYILLPIAVNY